MNVLVKWPRPERGGTRTAVSVRSECESTQVSSYKERWEHKQLYVRTQDHTAGGTRSRL